MIILRKGFDNFYDLIKKPVFYLTSEDPETAHEIFVSFLRVLHYTGLEKSVLDFGKRNNIVISNAAGFNKNGYISPTTLKYLGFDRGLVGTVTGESYEGSPRPRIKRFPETNSLVNWMKLPGIGAEQVAREMESYGEHGVPITINIAPTPEVVDFKSDLKKSILATRDLPCVDRYELNISCPNTGEKIEEYLSKLSGMLEVVCNSKKSEQKVYLKVSPDLTEENVEYIISTSNKFIVAGFTTTNTTTRHNSKYIPQSPGKGGASGDAVYEKSLAVQTMFHERTGRKLIACGGIGSSERMLERMSHGASEIQIFTPLIFEGTKLLRELKMYGV
ncbi:MAG: hypothetical protein AABX28_03315 [Nanoarchaeota archaeon]